MNRGEFKSDLKLGLTTWLRSTLEMVSGGVQIHGQVCVVSPNCRENSLGDHASRCHIIYNKLTAVDGIPFKTVAIHGEKPSCITCYVRPFVSIPWNYSL